MFLTMMMVKRKRTILKRTMMPRMTIIERTMVTIVKRTRMTIMKRTRMTIMKRTRMTIVMTIKTWQQCPWREGRGKEIHNFRR